MKPFNPTSFPSDSQALIIAAGSTAIAIAQVLRTLEHSYGIPWAQRIPVMAFDSAEVEHQRPLSTLYPELAQVSLADHELIPGRVPDLESRQRTAKEGRLPWAKPDWIRHPGLSQQNVGAGGNSRIGQHLFALSGNVFYNKLRHSLRTFANYQRQRDVLTEAADHHKPRLAITVYLVFSAIGGTGSGSYRDMLRQVAHIALSLNLRVKVIPMELGLGNLDPGNREVAARNQDLVFKSQQVDFEGGFRSENEAELPTDFCCDPPHILTNVNNHGEIASYNPLKNLTGHVLFFMCHTPLGPHFRQRGIDLHEALRPDPSGEQGYAATLGLAMIHSHQEKAALYTAHRLLGQLSEALLSSPHQQDAIKQAENLMARLPLIESPAEDLALQRLCRTQGRDTSDLRARIRDVFLERKGHRRGFGGCQDAYYAAQYTLDSELPKRILPAMRTEAGHFLKEGIAEIQQIASGYMTQLTGIGASRHFAEKMMQLIKNSEKFNYEKLAVAKAQYQTYIDQKVHLEADYHRLDNYSWLRRWFCFSTKQRFLQDYPHCIKMLLQSSIEIMARELLAQVIFPGVLQALNHLLAVYQELDIRINQWQRLLEQESQRLKTLSHEFYVPVGHELISSSIMDRHFDQVVNHEGGQDIMVQKLFVSYKQHFCDLTKFGATSPQDITATMLEPSLLMAQPGLDSLSVQNLFATVYPSAEAQIKQVEQMIRESDGRVRTVGEADTIPPKIKVLLVPDIPTGEKFVVLANKVDPAGGEWFPLVVPGMPIIGFFQYRSGIFFSQLMAESRKYYHPSTNPREKIELGAHPLMALAPEHQCSPEDISRDVAQGLVSGHVYPTDQGYVLNGTPHHKELLGQNLPEICLYLKQNYRSRIYLYCRFLAQLGRQPEPLKQKINLYLANNTSSTDPLVHELGSQPFVEVRQLAEAAEYYACQAVISAAIQAGHKPLDIDFQTQEL